MTKKLKITSKEIIDLLKKGLTITEIEKETNISRETLSRRLREDPKGQKYKNIHKKNNLLEKAIDQAKKLQKKKKLSYSDIEEIAKVNNISTNFLYKNIRHLLKTRSEKAKELALLVIEEYQRGISYKEISKKYNITTINIIYILKKYNIPFDRKKNK